jgi:hypothetical protein
MTSGAVAFGDLIGQIVPLFVEEEGAFTSTAQAVDDKVTGQLGIPGLPLT